MTIAGFRSSSNLRRPPVPDAANFESADAADAAHIASVHGVQDQILGRVFSLQGGAAGAAANDELHLKRMDFSPMFALTVDSDTLARLADDPGSGAYSREMSSIGST